MAMMSWQGAMQGLSNFGKARKGQPTQDFSNTLMPLMMLMLRSRG